MTQDTPATEGEAEENKLMRRPMLKGTGLGALALFATGTASGTTAGESGPEILGVETGKGNPENYTRQSSFENRWNSSMSVFTIVDGVVGRNIAWACSMLKNGMSEVGARDMSAGRVAESSALLTSGSAATVGSSAILKSGFSTSNWEFEEREAVVAVIDLDNEAAAVGSTTFEVH